jgi:hypothetical protein
MTEEGRRTVTTGLLWFPDDGTEDREGTVLDVMDHGSWAGRIVVDWFVSSSWR